MANPSASSEAITHRLPGLCAAPGLRLGQVTARSALIRHLRAIAAGRIRDGATSTAPYPGSTPSPAIETRATVGAAARGGTGRAPAIRDRLARKRPMRRSVRPEAVTAMVLILRGPACDDVTEAALPSAGG